MKACSSCGNPYPGKEGKLVMVLRDGRAVPGIACPDCTSAAMPIVTGRAGVTVDVAMADVAAAIARLVAVAEAAGKTRLAAHAKVAGLTMERFAGSEAPAGASS